MEQKTIETIADEAHLIEEYAAIPDRLRRIAQFIAEPKHKKELQTIAKLLESKVPDAFFKPAMLRALGIYEALSEQPLSDEEVAQKFGCGLSTAKGTIFGLKKGGVSFVETSATIRVAPTGRSRKSRKVQ
jgi:hypothetical protein